MTEAEIAQLQLDYEGRAGSLLAVDDRVAELVEDPARDRPALEHADPVPVRQRLAPGEHRITGDKFLPYEESLRIARAARPRGAEGQDGARAGVERRPGAHAPRRSACEGGADDGRRLAAADDARPRPAADRASRSRRSRRCSPATSRSTPGTGPTAVRTDRYTCVVWTETGEPELYDRDVDPYQLDNVAGDPAYAATQARLARKLARLEACRGVSCNVRPDRVAMDFLRTPDERFDDLPGFDLAPTYREVDGLRLAHIDEGEGRRSSSSTASRPGRSCGPEGDPARPRRRLPLHRPGLRGASAARTSRPTSRGTPTTATSSSTATLLTDLDLRDATAVVHDWGGPIGLRLATEHPDRIGRMVIMDTGLFTGEQRMTRPGRRSATSSSAPRTCPSASWSRAGRRGMNDAVQAAYEARFRALSRRPVPGRSR